ncbi:MAG TPA: DNA primase [bacterium]|nr:DNA primase [bacterium]
MDRFEDAKLRIKEGNDLVALIEQYLPLRPRGRTLVALCPFHAENSPSFTVFRETQHFRCFGCGKTGDVFTWLMERDGLTFREAMEQLAERAGVSLEGVFQKGRDERQAKLARSAHEVLAAVADFFHRTLLTPEGRHARDYLQQRGLDDAIVPWTLGVHPHDGAALQRFAREQKLPPEVLEQAGLLKNGREVFAGRLMFPIVDERGRTVAFGGRIVPGAPGSEPRPGSDYKPPKYLNSPESPFFSKRRVLYGLRAAKQAGERRLVVMEGYTDVIACHLAGFRGAVASLGTAFTAEHARTVERYADDGVVLMFDGDRAGRQAAERAHRELINSRLLVRIALVGDGDAEAKDPADVVLARPGEDEEAVVERRARFADTIDGAQDAMSVWFRLLRQRLDLTQAVNVEAAARECAVLLGQVEEPVRRAALTEEMARHLAVPAPALQRLMRTAPQRRAASAAGAADEAASSPGESAELPSLLQRTELELLACVLARPELLAELDVEALALEVEPIARLFEWAGEGLAIGRSSGADLFRYLFARAAEQPRLQALLAAAQERADKMKEADVVLHGIVAGRRRRQGEARRRALRERLRQAIAGGDQELAADLQRQMLEDLRRERPRAGDLADPGATGS